MLCVNVSVGVAAAVVTAVVAGTTRYLSLSAIVGAAASIRVAVLMVDDRLLLMLCVLTAAIVLVKNLPALRRIARKQEMRLSLEEDISYKFDEKF